MNKPVEDPCTVASEEGEVMLECGHIAVSLIPEVAHAVADDLHEHGDKAHEQRPAS